MAGLTRAVIKSSFKVWYRCGCMCHANIQTQVFKLSYLRIFARRVSRLLLYFCETTHCLRNDLFSEMNSSTYGRGPHSRTFYHPLPAHFTHATIMVLHGPNQSINQNVSRITITQRHTRARRSRSQHCHNGQQNLASREVTQALYAPHT